MRSARPTGSRRGLGRVRWRSQAGHIGVLGAAAAALTAVVVSVVAYSIKEAYDWLNAPAPIQAIPLHLPHIGPDPPPNPQLHDCYIQLAARENLQPGPQGWETPGVEKPTGTAANSQTLWNDYAANMNSYINSRHINWSSCNLSETPAPAQPPPEPTLVYQGTYSLSYPDLAGSADGGACPGYGGPPATMTVSGSSDTVTFRVPAPDGGSDFATGSVPSSYSFTIHGVLDERTGRILNLLGTFDTNTNSDGSTSVVIRNGQLSFTGDTPCSWNFTGTKR